MRAKFFLNSKNALLFFIFSLSVNLFLASSGKDSLKFAFKPFLRNAFVQADFFPADSSKTKKPWSVAKKATMLSVFCPGLGQIYNKKYWKAPLIYAALGGLGYSIVFNHKKYKGYSDALLLRNNPDQSVWTYPNYTSDNLVTLKRYYRKFRDLSIMGTALVYVIQIIDANVDGHLSNFDVDNISFKVSPYNYYENCFTGKKFNGISLTMHF